MLSVPQEGPNRWLVHYKTSLGCIARPHLKKERKGGRGREGGGRERETKNQNKRTNKQTTKNPKPKLAFTVREIFGLCILHLWVNSALT